MTTIQDDIKYIGLCDECCSVKSFSDERERDLWEKYHPHQENY